MGRFFYIPSGVARYVYNKCFPSFFVGVAFLFLFNSYSYSYTFTGAVGGAASIYIGGHNFVIANGQITFSALFTICDACGSWCGAYSPPSVTYPLPSSSNIVSWTFSACGNSVTGTGLSGSVSCSNVSSCGECPWIPGSYLSIVFEENTISNSCSSTQTGADSLLTQAQSECESNEGSEFFGEIKKKDSFYCVSGRCNACDSKWRDDLVNEAKQECCDKGFEPEPDRGVCLDPMESPDIGVESSSLYLLPKCTDKVADYESDSSFCKAPSSSSSSEESSSSSSEESSSSSSEEESSSSSEEISSSSEESSSSFEEVSSSSNNNCTEPPGYVSLLDGINTCIKKDNKCYVCNPDRGADCSLPWLWTGEQVNQEYWFKEVNCSGSGSVSSSSSATDIGGWGGSSSSGICPSHPLSSVPSNPLSACFEKNGRCYKCNSARGSECGNDWLWIYDFVPGNVGWWYEETSCEEEKNECPKDINNSTFSLQKKSVFENSNDNERKDVSYEIWGNKTKFYYDALGRRTQADPNTRRYLFEAPRRGNFNSYDMEIKDKLEGTLTANSSVSCYKNTKGEWVCKNDSELSFLRKETDDVCGKIGIDYGIVEPDGSITGGITCPFIELDTIVNNLRYKQIGTCDDGSPNILLTINLIYSTKLTRNEPFYVKEGYRFSNGYTATKENATAMRYHELGHVKYNNCIEFPKFTLSSSECICGSKADAEKRLKEERDKLSEKTLNAHLKLIKDMGVLFHNKYGNFGYATTYECP